jgi:BlaI family transcriptional regulator, penicillinase repressor
MAKQSAEAALSRRERQIMDILFAAGKASGPDIQAQLPGEPSYSTVRTLLRVLERKGFVKHTEVGLRYIYEPVSTVKVAGQSALKRVLRTFFEDSAPKAVAALLDAKSFSLSRAELDELSELIEKAKQIEKEKQS